MFSLLLYSVYGSQQVSIKMERVGQDSDKLPKKLPTFAKNCVFMMLPPVRERLRRY